MNNNNKILVTGGNGLVGSAIKTIKDQFPNYTFVFHQRTNADLSYWNDTINYFMAIQPTYVIHLAANVGGLYKNMNYKVEMLEDNLMINYNVLKACHAIGVKKLINCLSTCIFPDNTSYPINESMLHDGPPHDSNYAYAYAKRFLEIHSRTYNEQYNHNFICVIPTNIYGPYDNFNLEDAHVIPGLIHKCYLAKKHNKDFIVSGTGKPLRQFIFSEDLAKVIMWILENYNEKDSIIISPDDEVSIDHISKIIAKSFNYENRLVYDTSKSDGQYKKTSDNSKLKNFLPNFEFVNIQVGIKNTIDWFKQNYKTCRK